MKQLVITPSYVPVDSSVTLINAKIIDSLERVGIESVILTVSTKDTDYSINRDLLEIFPSKRRVYRVRSFEKGGKILALFRKTLFKLLPIIHYIPDYHFHWQALAILKLFTIRQKEKVDIIHSISAPYCSHIVGYFAKTLLKKPWICHLDDFWVDQPMEHFSRYRFINSWLEKRCFKKADAVLSTSREILDFAGKRYSEEIRKKFLYIPPAYDRDHYPDEEPPIPEKFIFSFLGVFYPKKREPLTLLDALVAIKKESPEIYRSMEFHFVGSFSPFYKEEVEKRGLDKTVLFFPRVDYRNSMKKMKESSVLLHIGFMNGKFEEDIHVSGKIFEYFGANRLILGVTTLTGPVADIIKENGGLVADYKNPEHIAETLTKIVSTSSPLSLSQWKNPPKTEEAYELSSVAQSYKKLFENLCHVQERES